MKYCENLMRRSFRAISRREVLKAGSIGAVSLGIISHVSSSVFADRAFEMQKQEQYQPSSTIYICALMRPKQGKERELRDALTSLVGPTSKEQGYISYYVHEEKDGALFLYEAWRSQADLDRHLQKSYVKDFVAKTGELLDSVNDAHFGSLITSTHDPKAGVARAKTFPAPVYIASVKHPRPGKADELRAALVSLVEPTKKEDGNLAYAIYQEKDGALFLYEVWRSREDLEAHFEKPYIKAFRSKVEALADRNEVHFGVLIPAWPGQGGG